MANIELSDYVTGLSSATLDGSEEVYLVGDEKTTTQDIADLNGNLITTIVNIGDWDMDANSTLTLAHGIADFKKIRSIDVIIRNDADITYYPLDSYSDNGSIVNFDTTNIYLLRLLGGIFDSADFDSTSYNRGYVTIQHIP